MPKTKTPPETPPPVSGFVALVTIAHDGDTYAPGETLELTHAAAAELLAIGAVRAAEAPAA